MELNGALSNPLQTDKGLLRGLAKLHGELSKAALRLSQQGDGPESRTLRQIPLRAGAVQNTVIKALANAKRPLRAREIHAAAEQLAGGPLSWNTVKDCLHKNARRPDSPIQRVSHGRYQHRDT
jgi:hypothetical protein